MKTLFINEGKIVGSVLYNFGTPGCSLPFEYQLDYENDATPGEVGWDAELVDGEWTFTAPPAPPQERLVNVVLWLSRFTPFERVNIRAARAGNPIIDDFWLMLEDTRMPNIDIALPSVAAGLDYLISQNLIAPERKAALLA
jgi:hypothetical protein